MINADTNCYTIVNTLLDDGDVLCFNKLVPLNDPLLYSGGFVRRFFLCIFYDCLHPFYSSSPASLYRLSLYWLFSPLVRGSI